MTRSPLRIRSFHLLMAVLLVALAQAARAVGWETIRYNGNDYVTARSIKSFW